MLPKNQKELILGFTATQQSYRSQYDDVIEGKGRGIILLLWFVLTYYLGIGKADFITVDLQELARLSQQSPLQKR